MKDNRTSTAFISGVVWAGLGLMVALIVVMDRGMPPVFGAGIAVMVVLAGLWLTETMIPIVFTEEPRCRADTAIPQGKANKEG